MACVTLLRILSAKFKETAKRESETKVCAINTNLAFFLLFNSIKKKPFAIAIAKISKPESREQIPQNTKKRVPSEPAKGEPTIQQKFRRHSVNQAPSKPITKGERTGIVFFISQHLSLFGYPTGRFTRSTARPVLQFSWAARPTSPQPVRCIVSSAVLPTGPARLPRSSGRQKRPCRSRPSGSGAAFQGLLLILCPLPRTFAFVRRETAGGGRGCRGVRRRDG